jgi:hypothetical protein
LKIAGTAPVAKLPPIEISTSHPCSRCDILRKHSGDSPSRVRESGVALNYLQPGRIGEDNIMRKPLTGFYRVSFAAVISAACFQFGSAHAQAPDATAGEHITVTQADIDAAASVKFHSFHVMAAGIPGARQRATALNAESARRLAELEAERIDSDAVTPTPTPTATHFYPADLAKGEKNALLLPSAINHAVYINAPKAGAASWGDPEGYLRDLFKDQFIHLTDQYTGSTKDNYTVGKNAMATYSLYGNVIYEHELWAIVHAVAKTKGYGSGTGHIYHLFLPNNMDTCFEETDVCYSPDNFIAWVFCGYHDWIDFSAKGDIGLVFFTVQPYQNVDGCAVHEPTPNGKLIDSTNSTLSHEVFETITDPEPPNGFTNQITLDEEGYEISDECQPVTDDNGDFFIPTFPINGKKYAVQLEYSNFYHACAAQP